MVINEVTTSVQPMMARFLDNPDYPEDLFLTGAQAAELVDSNTMLVVVDVNRPSITDAPELLKLVNDHCGDGISIARAARSSATRCSLM